MTRCWPNGRRGWRRNETPRIHPRTQRKGATAIANEALTGIGAVISRRAGRAKTRDGYIRLVLRIAALALAAWLILTFAFTFIRVPDQSLAPALKEGDLCVVFRTGLQRTLAGGFRKDDVVVFRADGRRFVGRVTAVAGDKVEIRNSGRVTVNGVTQPAAAAARTDAQGNQETRFTVPQGCLFVLNAEYPAEQDGREPGTISLDSVEGKIITILRRRGL